MSSTGAPGTRPAPPWLEAPRTGREVAPVGACPYKGLLRFEPEDAGWYFGRERLVAELVATVASTPGTGVFGASGSGKSSLVRAGLLAALGDDALPGQCAAGRACSSHPAPIPCSSWRGLSHPDVMPRRRITFATGCSRTPSR